MSDTPSVLDLEARMHRQFTPWVNDHIERYPKLVSDLGYNPSKYPEQSIAEAKTPINGRLDVLPEEWAMRALQYRMHGSLGRVATQKLLKQFQEGGKATTLKESLQEGKNVALVTPHTSLDDIAKALVAASVSIGSKSRLSQNGLIINKLMTREAFGKKSMAERIGSFTNTYWVIPDSESSRKWNIDEEAVKRVNHSGIKAILRDKHQGGAMFAIAPSGSGIIENHDSLTMPVIPQGSASILKKFDALLPVAIWQDPKSRSARKYSSVGELMLKGEHYDIESSDEYIANYIGSVLCTELANISKLPVRYRQHSGIKSPLISQPEIARNQT